MSENTEIKQKQSKLPWVIVGILCLALAGGCIYIYQDLHKSNTADAAGQTNAAGANRTGQRNQNPAMRAVSSILRLQQQQDQKLALTADQKKKLIPLVQDLKNTANPSQQFLQDKATAIEQVLTDDQKNLLSQRPNGQGNGQWGGQQGAGQGQNPGQNQGQNQQGDQRPAQGSGQRQFNVSDLYDRVLKALQA